MLVGVRLRMNVSPVSFLPSSYEGEVSAKRTEGSSAPHASRREEVPNLAGRSQERIVIGAQQGEQQMVRPLAVDPEVLARQPLLVEADLGQHSLGRLVMRQARRLEPVQPE